mgnify:CR=1 FL=1
MDDVEKSRIRMSHWIEHNVDHLHGYNEVAETLEKNGYSEAATMIRRGINLIQAANKEFQQAMAALKEGFGDHSQSESHSHEHELAHKHPHSHGHGVKK